MRELGRLDALNAAEEEDACGMAWVEPLYSRAEVNRAARLIFPKDIGIAIGSLEEFDHTFAVVNNWRAAHYWPLNAATVTLKRKAEAVYPSALVSRRIKRLTSIGSKLWTMPTLSLTQMQDIGGCRAIVANVAQVDRLTRRYTEEPIWESFQKMDDYIDAPRDSGYRGVHLIYKYAATKVAWQGMKIEVQLRSSKMHAWATAVEIVGTFTHQALKRSRGEADWLRFFQLMSSTIARVEGTPLVPDTPRPSQLKKELRHCADTLRVRDVLLGYRLALNQIARPSVEHKNARWFVLVLDTKAKTLTRYPYSNRELPAAQAQLESIERQTDPSVDAVLVSVDQAKNLRRAYPNYYLDADVFLELLDQALS